MDTLHAGRRIIRICEFLWSSPPISDTPKSVQDRNDSLSKAPAELTSESHYDLTKIIPQIEESIVRIDVWGKNSRAKGNGIFIDPSGLVVTNYHLVRGAEKISLSFPSDKDKKVFQVEGWLSVRTGHDLVLLKINPGKEKLRSFKLSKKPPIKGERMLTFNYSPIHGFTVYDGIVSAVRSGEETRNMLQQVVNNNIYENELGYELDAEWVESTALISPGSSGGPLVNVKGEAVGIVTWMNGVNHTSFSISSTCIQKLVSEAGKQPKPLSELPNIPPDAKKGKENGGGEQKGVGNGGHL